MSISVEPYNYEIKELNLTNYRGENIDIQEIMQTLDIYEDIFSNTIYGEMLMDEALNLPETFPIIGEETLKVRFTTSSQLNFDTFEKEFHIFKISNMNLTNEKRKTYMVHFTTPQTEYNFQKRIRKSYNGKIHNIIKTIARNQLNISENNLFIEETKNNKNFIVPNWLPFQAINFLSKHALRNNDADANYLFFESKDGFHFASIASLFEQDVSQHIKYNVSTIENKTYTLNSAQDYYYENHFDTLMNIQKGMYGNTVYTHDIINKKFKKKTFNYNKEFDSETHIEPSGKKLTFDRTSYPENKIKFYPNEYFYRDQDEKQIPNRTSQMQQIENYVLNVIVPGNSNQKVGNIINFDIPSTKNEEEFENNAFLSGRFLITNIRHSFTKDNYTMVHELRKDAFSPRVK